MSELQWFRDDVYFTKNIFLWGDFVGKKSSAVNLQDDSKQTAYEFLGSEY